MPPVRGRPLPDDSRSEPATAREKQSNSASTNKARRNGAVAQAASTLVKDSSALNNSVTSSNTAGTGISWSTEQTQLLHAYRSAYGVEAPSAMKSALSTALLTIPGIGQHSPTMARAKDKRRTGKEQLALAVRKHFNSLAVNETDVVVDFLYSVKFQDKVFKMRFAPPSSN